MWHAQSNCFFFLACSCMPHIAVADVVGLANVFSFGAAFGLVPRSTFCVCFVGPQESTSEGAMLDRMPGCAGQNLNLPLRMGVWQCLLRRMQGTRERRQVAVLRFASLQRAAGAMLRPVCLSGTASTVAASAWRPELCAWTAWASLPYPPSLDCVRLCWRVCPVTLEVGKDNGASC